MIFDSRDLHWKHDWVWDALWSMVYSGFVVAIVYILQPNSKSDLLCDIEELLDETLTEIPTQNDIDLDDTDNDEECEVDIYSSHMSEEIEMHEFGGESSQRS